MERNQRVGMKVIDPRKNQEKPVDTRLEGGQKQSVQLLAIHKGKPGVQKRKKEMRDVISRLVTKMLPGPRFPPDLDYLRTKRTIRRWVSKDDVAILPGGFAILSGHDQFLVVTDLIGGCKCYADMWRIVAVRVWCNNYIENAVTCTIQPLGTDIDSNCFNDREAMFSITSRSESFPAHMEVIPARDTPMGCWHKSTTVNTSGVLFNFYADQGDTSSGNWANITMDIEFEYVENIVGGPQGYTRTSSIVPSTPGTLGGRNIMAGGFVLQAINNLT